jgi:hypothetical protein
VTRADDQPAENGAGPAAGLICDSSNISLVRFRERTVRRRESIALLGGAAAIRRSVRFHVDDHGPRLSNLSKAAVGRCLSACSFRLARKHAVRDRCRAEIADAVWRAFCSALRRTVKLVSDPHGFPPREAPLRPRQENWLHFAKKRQRRFLALPLWRLPKAYTGSATVLVDELDARGLQGSSDCLIVSSRSPKLVSSVSCAAKQT